MSKDGARDKQLKTRLSKERSVDAKLQALHGEAEKLQAAWDAAGREINEKAERLEAQFEERSKVLSEEMDKLEAEAERAEHAADESKEKWLSAASPRFPPLV